MGRVRYSMDVQAIVDRDRNDSICVRNARRVASSGEDSGVIANSYVLFTRLFFFSMSYPEESVLIRASEKAPTDTFPARTKTCEVISYGPCSWISSRR